MAVDLKIQAESPISARIKERVRRVRDLVMDEGPISFYDVAERWQQELVMAYPGSGKTRAAIEMANELWDQDRLATLYLTLSHSNIEEHLDRLSIVGKDADWAHWRGHEVTCDRSTFNKAGYLGYGSCKCERERFVATQPTFAPLDYILPALPDSDSPLIDSVYDYFYWIVDEIDFRRLLGHMVVGKADVVATLHKISDESVHKLLTALVYLMRSNSVYKLSGHELYAAIEQWCASCGHTLQTITDRIGDSRSSEVYPSSALDDPEVTINFLPAFIPILQEEVSAYISGQQFNPRIHIAGTGAQPELRIWWRKEVKDLEQGSRSQPSTLILDATADPELLELVFNGLQVVSNDLPPWPKNVHVFQWQDDLVSRSALGMRFQSNVMSPKSINDRERWYQRILDALIDFSSTDRIGLITHRAIEDEARKAIENFGFHDVRSMHYGDERGSNSLEDAKVLVILGLPIPNIEAFQEEAEAFLFDVGELDFTWETQEIDLQSVDGQSIPVKVGGYWTDYVGRYYHQKCQASLFQALHRIRPYIVPPEDDKYVFTFTNMPINGVMVEGVLRDPEKLRIEQRINAATGVLCGRLAETGVCTTSDLAVDLNSIEETSTQTLRRWILENVDILTRATSSRFVPGKGNRPGVFHNL